MYWIRTLRGNLSGSVLDDREGRAKAIEEEGPAESESAAAEAKDGCPVEAIEEA